MKKWILTASVFILAAATFWWWQGSQASASASASLLPLLAEDDISGYERALEPHQISFPRDLGPHESFRTEWWYYTGNLNAEDGREFGYQFTVFRRALTPENGNGDGSDWRTNQIYFAHLTLSDIANGDFYQEERYSRGSTGLAGAQSVPYRVWVEDWAAAETKPSRVTIKADTEAIGLDLELTQSLPPILQGEDGLSRKGPDEGNASYYYSVVQQPTAGTIRIGEETIPVSGVSWKDHEYSTGSLPDGARGWDWFSVQFDDGSALMFGQIRLDAGQISPFSAGTFIEPDGQTRPLSAEDITLTVTDSWRSPDTGAEYPAAWDIAIDPIDLVLTAVPLMPNQELTVSTTYWEGAVKYEGTRDDQPVTGRGYVELTGYERPLGDALR